eukprot:CAMPEP_0201511520 /NCGR_PEP_ID=MMETSP0161_2-20130828/3972_1 /ASSEMBLY_ACC=CAM_ASM_000251 /TAXON_ID=180227 /ORGANISM="Neoparamoeba aestuarina, Strain SoJaBio B1-5/56/2" /LENGTH=186 /DNA_ID=CAMNT_0047907055 /DNA_START=131 /DNA_END=691 /DNA_ORIENTATION=-
MPSSDKDVEVTYAEDQEYEDGDFSDNEICLPTKDPYCDYSADKETSDWVHKYLMMGYDENVHRSDATLNCPCCFSLLCLDSQQHEVYLSQYRAMFVKNCIIDFDRMFFYDQTTPANKTPLVELQQEDIERAKLPPSEIYYKASCSLCETEVGVFDSDEVFHFYNVFPSEPPSTSAKQFADNRPGKD